QTAIEFAQAAKAALAGRETAATPTPPPPPHYPPTAATPAPPQAGLTLSQVGVSQIQSSPPNPESGSRRLVLGIVGLSVLTLVAVIALVVALVTRNGSDNPASSTESRPRPHARVPGSSPSSSASPSISAGPSGDYTNLLIQASDIGADKTLGPPQQNPGAVTGAGVTFSNDDGTHTVDDLLIVFATPGMAAQAAKERPPALSQYVTGAPQPFAVGTNGVMVVGSSPDNTKSVTYVVFAEGRVVVDLEFDSRPNDITPQDVVLDLARKQDEAIKNRMPSS
ncbi:hypothetical protein, partial [Mycobacterium stomatepiae]